MQQNMPPNEQTRNNLITAPVASPAPLGLNVLAFITGIIGCYYASFIIHYGVVSEQTAVGAAGLIAGIILVLAGMWEFRKNYMITATIFTGYGGFLGAFGLILLMAPFTGLRAVAGGVTATLGVVILSWTIFNGVVWVSTLRTNFTLIASIGLLFVTYILLTIGELASNLDILHIGGWLGVATALVTFFAAWVTMMSGAHPQEWFRFPVGRRVAAIE
jgi:succinate-acetate transporter protein